jgi:hypothetical protein
MKTIVYTQEQIDRYGIPFFEQGVVHPYVIGPKSRAQFEAKWRNFRVVQRAGRTEFFNGNKRIILDEEEKKNIVQEAWKDPETGFCAVDKLHERLSRDFFNIRRKDVIQGVKAIEVQQTHSGKMRMAITKPLISRFPGRIWCTDVKDLSHQQGFAGVNRGFKYVLVLMDTHSKYLIARPLRNLEAQTLLRELRAGFETVPDANPSKMIADSAFSNEVIREGLSEIGVSVLKTTSHKPTSNPAERMIRTLFTKLFKYLAERKTRVWYSALPALVRAYNTQKHDTIGMSPDEALNRTTDEVRAKVLSGIQKGAEKARDRERRKFPPVEVGDLVRVALTRIDPAIRSLQKKNRLKGHSLQGNWSNGVYPVLRVIQPNRFTVFPTYKVNGRAEIFKRDEVLKVSGVDESESESSSSESEPEIEEEVEEPVARPRREIRIPERFRD